MTGLWCVPLMWYKDELIKMIRNSIRVLDQFLNEHITQKLLDTGREISHISVIHQGTNVTVLGEIQMWIWIRSSLEYESNSKTNKDFFFFYISMKLVV